MMTPARQHRVVAAAFESLRPEHRQVLLKAYYQGHSASETAQALGLPLPVVKRRIYEAMRELSQLLAQEGLPIRATVDQARLAA
jgi:RNA polymerase sigma-70 factor (ECF subfamily)